MSLFKFREKQSYLIDKQFGREPKLFFLNEEMNFVPESEAKRFIVKKRDQYGFKEFFGIINNPHYKFKDDNHKPTLPFLDESNDNLYYEYQLDEPVILDIEHKKIPLYILKEFLDTSPNSFAGKARSKEQVAKYAQDRRSDIYKHYLKMNNRHIKTLSEVNCASVAYLYEYLNDGDKWEEGFEFAGYVDGLFEVGSYLTVSIDTDTFSDHTAIHELGHSVSYFLNDDLFHEWYDIAINTGEEPPSEYGKTECSEDFAESYAFYFMGGNEKLYLQHKCPTRFKYMKNLEHVGNSSLMNTLIASNELTQRFKLYDKVIYNVQ